jgi:hypothetical protein
MEFVAALMAALYQIQDDPNHKGTISLPNSLVLTCEPPQYVIGDGEAARFVFPVLDNLREFANAMESAIAPNRKSADRPNTTAREPEAQALGRHCPRSVLNAANRVCFNRHFSYVKENPEPTGLEPVRINLFHR